MILGYVLILHYIKSKYLFHDILLKILGKQEAKDRVMSKKIPNLGLGIKFYSHSIRVATSLYINHLC